MRARAVLFSITLFGLATAAIPSSAAVGVTQGEPQRRELAGDRLRAGRARDAILELDLPSARSILEGANPADGLVAIERARLEIYSGNYDAAVTLLERADLSSTVEGAELGDIARGCARGMAATIKVQADGVEVTLQDEDDRALVPILADTANKARAQLQKDLGVELPRPVRIDLVRDQFTLAAMTGLPEEAAHTTGTVAVAKWGRVTMVSPRATTFGYPWLDTLAHEMTHLALTQGTRDKAPLWLQEGVAKRQETRWRPVEPLDDFPSPDAIASAGLEKGLGRALDKLGPSIAMLPTPEEAQVAYAEVSSFLRYWTKEVGDEGLPKLVKGLKASNRPDDISAVIQEVSSLDLAAWDKRWRAHLAETPHNLPPDLVPGAPPMNLHVVAQRARMGELLAGRGHMKEAAVEYAAAHKLAPFDSQLRCWLADAQLASGAREKAVSTLEKIDDLHSRAGRLFSLRGLLFDTPHRKDDFSIGISLDPLDPNVACEELAKPGVPSDPIRAALCQAARNVPTAPALAPASK
jgi:hypothetical protein